MITDIFARRYANVEIRKQYFKQDQILCNQVWKMMSSGLLWDSYVTESVSEKAEANFKVVNDILALELGVDYLSDRWWFRKYEWNGAQHTQTNTNKYSVICKNFLTKLPDDVANGDDWMKERISFTRLSP